MTTETPSPEYLAKLKATFKESQPIQETSTQPSLSTIDSALHLTDLESELTNLDNNIFEYKRQSAVDFISITLDLTKAFLKSDYEKNPTVFKSSNLKDQTTTAIRSAETIALAITSYTESTFRQRMENGLIPDAFKTRKADLQLQIETLLKTAKEDPALLRNIALAVQQGNKQLLAQQATTHLGQPQAPRLKPIPNPELTKVIHSELERNKLSIVEKPLTNVGDLAFKDSETTEPLEGTYLADFQDNVSDFNQKAADFIDTLLSKHPEAAIEPTNTTELPNLNQVVPKE